MNNDENVIKQKLNRLLDSMGIVASHMYKPARNSVKVIFPTEKEIDKVIENEEVFKAENFEPKMSLSLKASRTVFVTNFDHALLQTYSKENIMEILKGQKLKVKDIYIMKSKKSFKIEMTSRNQAKELLKKEAIDIGGIRITNTSIEPEIDPTINQCWECGILEPNHNSQNCTGRKICIKCGVSQTDHKFFNCPIPKNINEMSEYHKRARYCAACGTKGTHTTLDHRACPKKRNILRERAIEEREKLIESKETNKKEIELIKKVLDISSTNEYPHLKTQDHSKIATIISLVLLDEASSPGIFDTKLKEACNANGLPAINYKLEPNTAKNFQQTLCGHPTISKSKSSFSPKTSKYYNDSMRQKRNKSPEDLHEHENSEYNNRTEKKPRKIIVNTQKGSTEEIHNKLMKELEKYIIMIESDDNVETETVTRTLTLEKLQELLLNNKIINSTEWTLLIRRYLEKLITLGQKYEKIDVKIQEVNINSLEISIMRTMENEESYEKGNLHLDESSDFDDDSEYSTNSQEDAFNQIKNTDSVDSIENLLEEIRAEPYNDSNIGEFIDSLTNNKSKENEPKATVSSERISSYPLDYYVKNGTFSE